MHDTSHRTIFVSNKHAKEIEMRAIAEVEFGGPVALLVLPTPEVRADKPLISVRAAGVNPFD